MTKANKKTTVEKINRISEGLRYCAHCASEGAPCENCPIYEECRSLVAKLALEAIEKLMREREEREDLLDAAFSTIAELQEAQHPNRSNRLDAASRILQSKGGLTMENKWIPVTEGLPESEEIVLVTDGRKTGQRIVVKAFRYLDGDESKWHGPTGMHEVIAWMPLPKPWDGETK